MPLQLLRIFVAATVLSAVTTLSAVAANIIIPPTLMTPFPTTACIWLASWCNFKIPPAGMSFTDQEFSFQTQWKFLGDYPYVVNFGYNLAEDDPLILGGLRRYNSPFVIVGGAVDTNGDKYPTYKFIGSYPTLPALALQIESQDPKDAPKGELVFQAIQPRVAFAPMAGPLPKSLQKITIEWTIFNIGTDKPEGGATMAAEGSPPLPNDSIIGATATIPGFRLFGQIAPGEFLFLNPRETPLQIASSSGLFLTGEIDAMIYSLMSNTMYGVIGNLTLSGADTFSPYFLGTLPDLDSEVLRHMDATLNPSSSSFIAGALPYLVLHPRGNLYDLTAGFTLPIDVKMDPEIITAQATVVPEPNVVLLLLAGLGVTFLARSRQRRIATNANVVPLRSGSAAS